MACCLVGTKLLSEPMLEHSNLRNKLKSNFKKKSHIFIQEHTFVNVVYKYAQIRLDLNVLRTTQVPYDVFLQYISDNHVKNYS